MIADYEVFTRASTLVHSVQGAALLLLGAGEAYTLKKPGHKAGLVGPLALILGGAAAFCVLLAIPGGWSLTGLKQALAVRTGMYLFVAFSCFFGAAGLSLLMRNAAAGRSRGWETVSLLLLALAGALYFLVAGRVNEEVYRRVMAAHAFIGGALLLAVLAKAAHLRWDRKALHLAWAALVVAAAFQLLAYREDPAAYSSHIVALEAGPALPPAAAKDLVAKPADAAHPAEKRPGR